MYKSNGHFFSQPLVKILVQEHAVTSGDAQENIDKQKIQRMWRFKLAVKGRQEDDPGIRVSLMK